MAIAAETRACNRSALTTQFGEGWISETDYTAEVGARLTVRYTGAPVTLDDVQAAVDGIPGREGGARARRERCVRQPAWDSPPRSGASSRTRSPSGTSKVLQVDSVGPKVGGELRRQGFIAIMATLALILVYVGFRFDLAFAPGAVLALFHDVTVVVGIFVITGHEVQPAA